MSEEAQGCGFGGEEGRGTNEGVIKDGWFGVGVGPTPLNLIFFGIKILFFIFYFLSTWSSMSEKYGFCICYIIT